MQKLKYPVNYIAITNYFKKGEHNGIDLGWNSKHGGKNQPIYAPADGTVYAIKDKDKTKKSWGNYVKIYHGKLNGKKLYTLSGHMLDGIKVKKGKKVKQGDLLGYMGSTGNSNGPHDHYEVYYGGAGTSFRVDPEKYTYVYPKQTVSTNKSATKGLKYYTPAKKEYYVVKKGDTLTKIANKFNTTVEKLVKLNKIKDKNKLKVGQKLRVK